MDLDKEIEKYENEKKMLIILHSEIRERLEKYRAVHESNLHKYNELSDKMLLNSELSDRDIELIKILPANMLKLQKYQEIETRKKESVARNYHNVVSTLRNLLEQKERNKPKS